MSINDEISKLKQLLIHRPDKGIAQVTPNKAVELLYEDIVYLPYMQEEHDVFTNVIKAFIGPQNIFDFEDLLNTVLDDEKYRVSILNEIAEHEGISDEHKKSLLHKPQLGSILVSGTDGKTQFLPPLPNLIFCRDIGTVINDHLLITKFAKKARLREYILSKYVFSHHPLFRTFHNKLLLVDEKDPLQTIEGGDVMMLDKETLLIGCSERTTKLAIENLVNQLFHKNVIKQVVEIDIPKVRYCMHFDTVFTRLSEQDFIVYGPLLLSDLQTTVYESGQTPKTVALNELLKNKIPGLNYLLCGDNQSPHAEREQWTDACNVFCLKPGVALTYDRNPMTEKAFKKAGYSIIAAKDILHDFAYMNLLPEEVEKTIITIPGSELSRARGGTHCMTMPLWRA